jgi:hypothetical protein
MKRSNEEVDDSDEYEDEDNGDETEDEDDEDEEEDECEEDDNDEVTLTTEEVDDLLVHVPWVRWVGDRDEFGFQKLEKTFKSDQFGHPIWPSDEEK